MKHHKTTDNWIMLGLTLVAFLLRVYRLDAQSYWIDEGLTVYYANLSLAELMTNFQTVRATPPLYHTLTLYWVDLLGDGEFSLRYFSLLFSVLAVPLIYRLGRTLGGRQLGLLAAALLTIAPYQIWHAQDARNYSMLTAAAAMSFWGFVNLWRYGGWRWWLIYVIGTEWGIMVHYHGLIVIGVQGLFFLLTWQRHWRYYLSWAGTLVLILSPFVAWMVLGSRLWQGVHWLPQVALGESYLRSALAYSVGEMVPRPQAIWLTAIFIVFAIIGLVYAFRHSWRGWQGHEMGFFFIAFLLAPNLAAWLYSELRTPVYLERYLIAVQVGYLLLVAVGILGLGRGLNRVTMLKSVPQPIWLIGLLLPFGLVSGWVLQHHYFDPVYAKPSWRQVAEKIDQFALPGDAIVMTGDGGELLFDFYYQGQLPVFDDFNTPVPEPDEARQRLAEIARQHRRIWYTPYGVDIDATLTHWLTENSHPAWHSWLGRKQLGLYYTGPAVLDRLESLDHHFQDAAGQGPQLLRVALPGEAVAAGDLLPLTLTWTTTTPLAQDLKLSMRLINAQGDLFMQSDWPPLSQSRPVTTWHVDEMILDKRSLWLPADLPPGVYALHLVVYDPVTGAGLGQPALIDALEIGPAAVTPPLSAFARPNATEVAFGPLNLVGYAAPAEIKPGQPMWLWLYWQAQADLSPDTAIQIALQTPDENIATTIPLSDAVGPLDSWQVGQVRRAVYHLPTSPKLMADSVELRVAILGENSNVIVERTLTDVALKQRLRVYDRPAVAQPLQQGFGNPPQVMLLGHNLADEPVSSGETLALNLYWQAEALIAVDYTVFVQLLNSAQQVVAQQDQPPLAGQAPTTTWLPGEIVADSYALPIPDLPSGDYRLIAGLYNSTTGQRLPLTSGSDFVELGIVVVQ